MPQRPIYEYWKNRVKFHLTGCEGHFGNTKILHLIEADAKILARSDDPVKVCLAATYPSVRSIARIRINEWQPQSATEKASYGLFHWPESMESWALPWEASTAALELLNALKDTDLQGPEIISGRPSIRLASAFWHITVAIPDAPIQFRLLVQLSPSSS